MQFDQAPGLLSCRRLRMTHRLLSKGVYGMTTALRLSALIFVFAQINCNGWNEPQWSC